MFKYYFYRKKDKFKIYICKNLLLNYGCSCIRQDIIYQEKRIGENFYNFWIFQIGYRININENEKFGF